MTLGRLAGAKLVIHPTFWLIVGYVALLGLTAGLDFRSLTVEVGFVLAVFGCVVLHELGHVLAARRYGIGTQSITLYPIGGVARLERMPERPGQELVVALAGPAVNVALAIVSASTLLAVQSEFLARLTIANVVLVAFNILPAFPMDGGRVLRALLAMRTNAVQATNIAAGVAKGMAALFVMAGLFWNPFLILIAAFVWFGATTEARALTVRQSLSGTPVMQATMADYLMLRPHDPLSYAVELTLDSTQKDFPVEIGGTIVGSLTQAELLRGVTERGSKARVADVMRASPQSVAGDRPLAEGVDLIRRTGAPFVIVTEEGESVGMLTLDNVEEFIRLRAAMRGRPPVRIERAPLRGKQAGAQSMPS